MEPSVRSAGGRPKRLLHDRRLARADTPGERRRRRRGVLRRRRVTLRGAPAEPHAGVRGVR